MPAEVTKANQEYIEKNAELPVKQLAKDTGLTAAAVRAVLRKKKRREEEGPAIDPATGTVEPHPDLFQRHAGTYSMTAPMSEAADKLLGTSPYSSKDAKDDENKEFMDRFGRSIARI